MPNLSEKHRQMIENAPKQYRLILDSDRSYGSDAKFDGQIIDLEYLEWLDYEQVDFERLPFGLEGAAVIWGNILVRSGVAEWATVMEDRLVLQSTDHEVRGGYVWPLAHLWTCLASSLGHGCRFSWAMQEVVVRFWQLLEDDNPARDALRKLVQYDFDNRHIYWHHVKELMPRIECDGNQK